MLCSDDLHPEMLGKGHLDILVARLISEGFDLFDVIRSCTVNPSMHYRLEAGLLRKGDPADMIMVSDLHKMDVLQTWINGTKVYEGGHVLFSYTGAEHVNKFKCSEITKEQIRVDNTGRSIRVIKASDGELITREIRMESGSGPSVEPDTGKDMLKLVVKDRYGDAPPATGFISGFRLKAGALASSVAHDSHNIICAGTNDDDIINAVNEIVRMKGGLAVSVYGKVNSLPLPVAGIMSDQPVETVAAAYQDLSQIVIANGCEMSAPFMTLSFMALLVIPELKLSDRGLFDGKEFSFVPLFVE
jgi:adenine deaminase